jgi:hypothetical protein
MLSDTSSGKDLELVSYSGKSNSAEFANRLIPKINNKVTLLLTGHNDATKYN